jgi:hypothetical protein
MPSTWGGGGGCVEPVRSVLGSFHHPIWLLLLVIEGGEQGFTGGSNSQACAAQMHPPFPALSHPFFPSPFTPLRPDKHRPAPTHPPTPTDPTTHPPTRPPTRTHPRARQRPPTGPPCAGKEVPEVHRRQEGHARPQAVPREDQAEGGREGGRGAVDAEKQAVQLLGSLRARACAGRVGWRGGGRETGRGRERGRAGRQAEKGWGVYFVARLRQGGTNQAAQGPLRLGLG